MYYFFSVATKHLAPAGLSYNSAVALSVMSPGHVGQELSSITPPAYDL